MTSISSGSPHPPRSEVLEHVAQVAATLNSRLGEITLDMRKVLATEIAELDVDPQLIDLLGASIEGNLDNILHALQHNISVDRVEPPSAAYEYARRLAQRGVPVNALVRAYRLGQQFLLRTAFTESSTRDVSADVRAAAYDEMVHAIFDYIDWITQRVISVYEEEREGWLADRNSARVAKVEQLITSGAADVDLAEKTIGYRLRVMHLAAVLWVDETGAQHDQLTRFTRTVRELASEVGATRPPLVIGRDRASAWAWIQVSPEFQFTPELARWSPGHAQELPTPVIALGSPQPGLEGFRRSHREAVLAQAVAVVRDKTSRAIVSYEEPGIDIAALLTHDLDHTRAWVRATLGGLVTADEQNERHRETLLCFLRNQCSYTATADAMLMHKNSIKYRVTVAEKVLGRNVNEDRLGIELALTACHWLGDAILS